MNQTDKEILEQARYIMEAGRLLHDRVSLIFVGHMAGGRKKIKLTELSPPQIFAIKATRKRGETTITDLARMLRVSAPSASAMVERLVERGILTRRRSETDRRKVVVRISEEAAEDIRQIEEKIVGSFAELTRKLGPETTRKWCEVLRHVQTVLEEEEREEGEGKGQGEQEGEREGEKDEQN